jgi:hypothetical protein
LSQPIELIVLSIKERAARCRLPGTDRVISLRASRLWDIVPGAIAVVKPRKQWSYAGHPYLSGEIESARFEVAALGLVPLKLEDQKMWSPDEQYWDEKNEPSEEAERVFDRMLWLNPSDNQGVRATTLRQIVRRAPSAAHLSAASTSSPRTPLGGKHARRSSIVNSWKTIPLRPHAKWVGTLASASPVTTRLGKRAAGARTGPPLLKEGPIGRSRTYPRRVRTGVDSARRHPAQAHAVAERK